MTPRELLEPGRGPRQGPRESPSVQPRRGPALGAPGVGQEVLRHSPPVSLRFIYGEAAFLCLISTPPAFWPVPGPKNARNVDAFLLVSPLPKQTAASGPGGCTYKGKTCCRLRPGQKYFKSSGPPCAGNWPWDQNTSPPPPATSSLPSSKPQVPP